ncbi:unnamed protein product, partial [Mesorhabditis belari]|uniref:MRH domain-containing protein n=1 Tax=Mesorhabditis belari TaxID=2138241 RepID=A0AAF3FFI8_9BILA
MWIILATFLFLKATKAYRECDQSDFRYEYTQCSETGERWRVGIPREKSDCRGGVPQPEKGLNCSFSCRPGSYLDLETQKCRPCNAGSYSLGGGARFEEFTHFPAGFSVENIDSMADLVMQTSTQTTTIQCPEEAGWLVKDTELLYVPSPCLSKLSFTTTLVRPGYVEYVYRMPKNSRGLAMNVVVKNEQCQSYRDEVKSMLMNGAQRQDERREGHHDETTNGDWQRKRLELRSGQNVISWTVVNNRELSSQKEPIRMARIDVVGIAFTRECPLCPSGTFSPSGSAECQPCKPGTFSSKGSEQCGICPQSQYSGYKSSRCLDRPACQQTDFYPVHEPCLKGKTKVAYKKVMPALCRDDLPGAAKVPPDEPEKSCPRCNPGMAVNSSGLCAFCGKDEFSDGDDCKKCPTSTIPNYGYHYVQWTAIPPNIETKCEYISEEVLARCDIGATWLADGSALVTAPSLQTGIALELVLSVNEGFTNPLLPRNVIPSSTNPIAHLTIVFETHCADDSCVIYFIENATPLGPSPLYRFLGAFNGPQEKRVWTHPIAKRTPMKYLVAFIRSRAVNGEDSVTDQARVFSINVTNVGHRDGVQGGGASECVACPSMSSGDCIPCPKGHYMTSPDHKCIKCPEGTYLNISSSRIGIENCVKCGPNLESDGDSCISTGKFEINLQGNKTRSYDLSSLKNKALVVEGVKVFAREGTSYFHTFNVSLLGGNVQCREDFEQKDQLMLYGNIYGNNLETVDGAACRITAIPLIGNGTNKIAHISPLLLGIQLEAITMEKEWNGWKLSDKLLDLAFVSNGSKMSPDLHFFFSTPSIGSDICPRGSAIVVTARCDPQQNKAELHLPRSCPDGTCDGCLYHAMLESSISCPLCTPSDYTVINGECIDGQQTVHTIPDKQCVLSGAALQERKQHCSVLSAHLKLLITAGTLALFGLALILICICQKNRRLEYKYMKLIESKGGGFELPIAETCGLESDEEDDEQQEDRVIFSKGRKGFFGKTKQKTTMAGGNGVNAPFVALDDSAED